VTDPAYATLPVLACMIPGCPTPATTHLTIIIAPDEYELPLCATHHLEYSQPGHLKFLKTLALDEGESSEPEAPAEPGPEVVTKPSRRAPS
jgi:hypothetical protein